MRKIETKVGKKRILCIYPSYFCNRGVSHACLSVVSSMSSSNLNVEVMGISSDKEISSPFYTNTISPTINPIAYRLFSGEKLQRLCEYRFLKKLRDDDIAYLWPGTSINLIEKIKRQGNKIVVENINCHQFISRQILDSEYRKLDLKPSHTITDDSIQDEFRKLELSDYVFSPSPAVSESLLSSGIANEKILQTSYGLSENEIFECQFNYKKNRPLTAIFVGRIGVRKGIHLVLNYWDKANINGILKVIGQVEDYGQEIIEPFLNHPKIQFLKYTNDLKKLYRDADFFILPSLEEGSPLVTYLALGAGLPCLVSPMGSGGIIKDGHEGFIIDPHDESGWIAAIRQMEIKPELREYQSKAAWKSAATYLWKNVGQKRANELLYRLEISN
ncbi:glycosyltransferase family 4 protein [Methylobacter sp.]|uniref:glycosyltransferase family 4 protein n=1 Tax=Methylobacter sp. TaxID=2051955 RepID=UPI003DA26AC8